MKYIISECFVVAYIRPKSSYVSEQKQGLNLKYLTQIPDKYFTDELFLQVLPPRRCTVVFFSVFCAFVLKIHNLRKAPGKITFEPCLPLRQNDSIGSEKGYF